MRFDAQRAVQEHADAWYGGEGLEAVARVRLEWEMDAGPVSVCLEAAGGKDRRMKAVVMYGSGIGNAVE